MLIALIILLAIAVFFGARAAAGLVLTLATLAALGFVGLVLYVVMAK